MLSTITTPIWPPFGAPGLETEQFGGQLGVWFHFPYMHHTIGDHPYIYPIVYPVRGLCATFHYVWLRSLGPGDRRRQKHRRKFTWRWRRRDEKKSPFLVVTSGETPGGGDWLVFRGRVTCWFFFFISKVTHPGVVNILFNSCSHNIYLFRTLSTCLVFTTSLHDCILRTRNAFFFEYMKKTLIQHNLHSPFGSNVEIFMSAKNKQK